MVVQGDANSLPFKDASFDCVISIKTIDYLNIIKILKEYKSFLRNNGLLIFSVGNRLSYKRSVHHF